MSDQNRFDWLIGIAESKIALVLLFALMVGVMMFPLHGSASENAMIWVEDGSYMYSRDITSDNDPIEITSLRREDAYASGCAAITADGKYAYLLNRYTSYDTASLYRVKLWKLSANSDKNENYIEKLDTDVRNNTLYVLDDGTLLYMCGENSFSAELRYYDGNGVRTMKTDVTGYLGDISYYHYDAFNYGFSVTDDQKVAVYTTMSEDYTYTIYCQNIGAIGGYDFFVDSDTSGYAVYDATHILYEKFDYANDNDIVEVYVGGMDVDPVKLADDAEGCCELSVFTETGMFYYTVAGETSLVTLADYVTNPHAESDAAAEEPDESDYVETVIRTDSWTGETYTETEIDWDAYREDYDTWYMGASVREDCFSLLEEVELTDMVYELCCYTADGGEPVLITGECADRDPIVSVMSGDSVAIYKKNLLPDEKLSIDDIVSFLLDYMEVFYGEDLKEEYVDYTSEYDLFGLDFNSFYGDEELEEVIAAYINAYLSSSTENDCYYYSVSGGGEQQLDISGCDLAGCQLTDVQLFDNGKQVALLFDNNIYVASVSEGSIGPLAAANAAYEADSLLCYDNGELYYMINGYRYDYNASLYKYRDDAWDTLILKEIDLGNIYEDSSMIFMSDYISPYGYTLTIFNAYGEMKTFEDVDSYKVLSNGNVVIHSPENTLRLYDGKEIATIAYEVERGSYYPIKEKNGTSLIIY